MDTWWEHWLVGIAVNHSVTFNFGSGKVSSPAIFETCFSLRQRYMDSHINKFYSFIISYFTD